ncbi:unnamed protein product [Lasius platythorax]|uniref:Uncharacterized protein n=1 Tax=Lasius platythorax TaxID=488582 RepID=A0AAV2NT96_9HYME
MPKDEKTWLWITADYRDGEIEYLQFIWPFKTSEIAMDFKKAIDDVRKNHQSAASARNKSATTDTDELLTTRRNRNHLRDESQFRRGDGCLKIRINGELLRLHTKERLSRLQREN